MNNPLNALPVDGDFIRRVNAACDRLAAEFGAGVVLLVLQPPPAGKVVMVTEGISNILPDFEDTPQAMAALLQTLAALTTVNDVLENEEKGPMQ